eukprot:9502355-Ditylum_brightwellii.AAC.2
MDKSKEEDDYDKIEDNPNDFDNGTVITQELARQLDVVEQKLEENKDGDSNKMQPGKDLLKS